MSPLESLEAVWRDFLARLGPPLAVPNPVPEPLRVLFGLELFWLALWLGAWAGLGRLALGRGFGRGLGLAFGGWLWWTLVPGGRLALALGLVSLAALGLLAARWSATGWGLRLRGRQRCPSCAEEVQLAARACRFCGRDLTGPISVE